MEITWYGHSCFLIKDSNEKRLLTDPYDRSLGYIMPNESVDIVLISHQHFDHNYSEELPGTPCIITDCGLHNVSNISINGIPSYHDKVHGAKRGENIIFIFEMDELRLCHLGDLGHLLTDEDINSIGEIDVLFIPVGGNYTIDGKEASIITKSLSPKIVIPMHYKTSTLSFPLEGVEHFVKYMKTGERINSDTLIIDEKPEENNCVKILEYKKTQ
jgi:L-ascorbate metabolism protein UlaG (beta-lactamase superfamily)